MLKFNTNLKKFKLFLSDGSKYFLSSKSLLICFCLSLSLISSLKVFNINFTKLHSDESLFLDILFNGDTIIYEDIFNIFRYNFFFLFTNFYLFFFKEPFAISVAHKFLMSFFFIFVLKDLIVKNFGLTRFLIIFLSFSYLNLFFLRESLTTLVGLALILLLNNKINKHDTNNFRGLNTIRNLIISIMICFMSCLRPQNLFVYFRPLISIYFAFLISINILVYIFFIRYYDLFSLQNLILIYTLSISILMVILLGLHHFKKNNFYKVIISILILFMVFLFLNSKNEILFIKNLLKNFSQFLNLDFIKYSLISLININPFPKVYYYFSHRLYLEYFLLFLPSIVTIILFYQVLLSFIKSEYRFYYNKHLFVGLGVILLLYSVPRLVIDVRIFLTLLTPFFLFLNLDLLNLKTISIFILILLIFTIIKSLFF